MKGLSSLSCEKLTFNFVVYNLLEVTNYGRVCAAEPVGAHCNCNLLETASRAALPLSRAASQDFHPSSEKWPKSFVICFTRFISHRKHKPMQRCALSSRLPRTRDRIYLMSTSVLTHLERFSILCDSAAGLSLREVTVESSEPSICPSVQPQDLLLAPSSSSSPHIRLLLRRYAAVSVYKDRSPCLSSQRCSLLCK